MHVIADNRIPDKAKKNLERFAYPMYFSSDGITYPAISGHPDIFFCVVDDQLIMAPNVPRSFQEKLTFKSISALRGNNYVSSKYPSTASYNALVNEKYLIHHSNYTDEILLNTSADKSVIHVPQGYTRCNLIALKNNHFITSDKGIETILTGLAFDVLYVNPKGILLPDFDHGFIGGTAGIFGNKLYFIGCLDYFDEGYKIRDFVSEYEIVELYDGPLYDGGSLLFIP